MAFINFSLKILTLFFALLQQKAFSLKTHFTKKKLESFKKCIITFKEIFSNNLFIRTFELISRH